MYIIRMTLYSYLNTAEINSESKGGEMDKIIRVWYYSYSSDFSLIRLISTDMLSLGVFVISGQSAFS